MLTAQIARSTDAQHAPEFFQQAIERVRTIPGVQAVGTINWLPLDGIGSATKFTIDDRPHPPSGEEPVADVRARTRCQEPLDDQKLS